MWSPQQYISDGKTKGVSEEILNNAVEQIEHVVNGPLNLPAYFLLITWLKERQRRIWRCAELLIELVKIHIGSSQLENGQVADVSFMYQLHI